MATARRRPRRDRPAFRRVAGRLGPSRDVRLGSPGAEPRMAGQGPVRRPIRPGGRPADARHVVPVGLVGVRGDRPQGVLVRLRLQAPALRHGRLLPRLSPDRPRRGDAPGRGLCRRRAGRVEPGGLCGVRPAVPVGRLVGRPPGGLGGGLGGDRLPRRAVLVGALPAIALLRHVDRRHGPDARRPDGGGLPGGLGRDGDAARRHRLGADPRRDPARPRRDRPATPSGSWSLRWVWSRT